MYGNANFWHKTMISSIIVLIKNMNDNKKPKVVKLNFEFDEANLSIEDKIILDHLSLVTHVAEA